jgi:acyl-CoA thioesterase FadM
LEQFRTASVLVRQEVGRAADPAVVLVTGRIRIACVEMDGIKTRAVPTPLREALAGFVLS